MVSLYTVSKLFYFNDDYKGEEIKFKAYKITPQQGTALCLKYELNYKENKLKNVFKYILRSEIIYKR